MKDSGKYKFETRAIHAGQEPDPTTGAVMTPLYLTTTYAQSSPGVHKGYDYSRAGNPTRKAYEDCLASLEEGKYGFAFASGCGATTTAIHLLKAGDHVVCSDDVYGGTFRLFDKIMSKKGIEFSYVNLTNFDSFQRALKNNTKMVWMETPTNPLLKLLDIQKISEKCRSRGIISIVDNTFMSPYFQKPLHLGADIAYHSTTKYVGGHSDATGGALITSRQDLAEEIQFLLMSIGAMASPFESFLCMRSLKTLAVRMDAHQKNAMQIAEFLEGHKKIERVLYPGLKSHPQHQLACEQMSGFGGMISFYLKGGLAQAKNLLENLNIFTLAESLGGVESLIEHPAIMTHSSIPPENRQKLGIGDNLIRISVGIENVEDLMQDLDLALKKVEV